MQTETRPAAGTFRRRFVISALGSLLVIGGGLATPSGHADGNREGASDPGTGLRFVNVLAEVAPPVVHSELPTEKEASALRNFADTSPHLLRKASPTSSAWSPAGRGRSEREGSVLITPWSATGRRRVADQMRFSRRSAESSMKFAPILRALL